VGVQIVLSRISIKPLLVRQYRVFRDYLSSEDKKKTFVQYKIQICYFQTYATLKNFALVYCGSQKVFRHSLGHYLANFGTFCCHEILALFGCDCAHPLLVTHDGFFLAHHKVDEKIVDKLRMECLGFKCLSLNDPHIDMGEQLTTRIRNVLMQYTE